LQSFFSYAAYVDVLLECHGSAFQLHQHYQGMKFAGSFHVVERWWSWKALPWHSSKTATYGAQKPAYDEQFYTQQLNVQANMRVKPAAVAWTASWMASGFSGRATASENAADRSHPLRATMQLSDTIFLFVKWLQLGKASDANVKRVQGFVLTAVCGLHGSVISSSWQIAPPNY